MDAAHAGICHNPVSTSAHQHNLQGEKDQVLLLIVQNSPPHPQPMFPGKNCV